jgi:hypothetical protein
MQANNEINALNDVYETLKGLDNAQIKRILVWVEDKFDLEKQPYLKAVEREASPAPAVFAPEALPVKKRRGRHPAKVEPVVEEPVTRLDESPAMQRFLKYDSFEDLLLFSTAYNNTAKVLLAAAYLQVKKNLKEFCSNDISSLFKEIGEEISQTSPFLSNLMNKKPPLVIRTGTQGPGLKARRNFRVTEEGLRIAGNYIKE